MGKHRERHSEDEFDGDMVQGVISEIEYALEDAEFFKQFEPKKSRQKRKSARDARRRIEQYWEDRKLTESLTEYYDHPED